MGLKKIKKKLDRFIRVSSYPKITNLVELQRLPYPKQLIIDVHSYCNANCKTCPYETLKSKTKKGVMEEALFEKIIDNFSLITKNNNFKGKVLFCNMGEIFVKPDLLHRIKYVADAGLNINIQTNASLMTEKVIDQLIDLNFKGSFTISCHGITPDVYANVMDLDLHTSLENIDYLISKYDKKKLKIQAIPYEWPTGEAQLVSDYWKKKGVTVRMPLPHNRAGLVTGIHAQYGQKLYGCRAERPLGEMVICYDGDVILCCNDMGQQVKVGNVSNATIEEVWNGKDYLDIIKQIYCNKPSPDDFICKKCEFGIRNPSILDRVLYNITYALKRQSTLHK